MQLYPSRFITLFFLCMFSSMFSSTHDNIYTTFQQFVDPINVYECEQLKGGLSNNMQYQCKVNEKRYVVRLLNESYVERKNEVLIHLHFADQGIAPHVYYYSDNYSLMTMDFIDSHTLTFEDAQKKSVLRNIAYTLRSIHESAIDDKLKEAIGKRDIRDDIIRWYNTTKKNNPCMPVVIEDAFNALGPICEVLEKESLPLVLSHNDIHPRNIFFTHDTIIVIDWELVGMNYIFFDVANYCVYACLDEKQEYYLLSHYLQRNPIVSEWDYFKNTKLLAFLFNIFAWFAFLGPIPDDISTVQDFSYYATIFARNTQANDYHFFFEFTFSLLKNFFQEYHLTF